MGGISLQHRDGFCQLLHVRFRDFLEFGPRPKLAPALLARSRPFAHPAVVHPGPNPRLLESGSTGNRCWLGIRFHARRFRRRQLELLGLAILPPFGCRRASIISPRSAHTWTLQWNLRDGSMVSIQRTDQTASLLRYNNGMPATNDLISGGIPNARTSER